MGGADATIKNKDGKSALDLAHSSEDILKYFTDEGLIKEEEKKPPVESNNGSEGGGDLDKEGSEGEEKKPPVDPNNGSGGEGDSNKDGDKEVATEEGDKNNGNGAGEIGEDGSKDKKEVVEIDVDNLFLSAIKSKDLEKVKEYIEKGPNLEKVDAQGRTPLHVASKISVEME